MSLFSLLLQSGLKTGSLMLRLGKLLLHSVLVLLLTCTINYLAKVLPPPSLCCHSLFHCMLFSLFWRGRLLRSLHLLALFFDFFFLFPLSLSVPYLFSFLFFSTSCFTAASISLPRTSSPYSINIYTCASEHADF